MEVERERGNESGEGREKFVATTSPREANLELIVVVYNSQTKLPELQLHSL